MLENVELSEGLQEIGYDSFGACTSLRHINFPSSLVWIFNNAFVKCSLREVIFPEGVQVIGPWAFQYCARLERVTI
ncbi:hypothetical protein ACHAWF_014961 [Thalassiosira exigua]